MDALPFAFNFLCFFFSVSILFDFFRSFPFIFSLQLRPFPLSHFLLLLNVHSWFFLSTLQIIYQKSSDTIHKTSINVAELESKQAFCTRLERLVVIFFNFLYWCFKIRRICQKKYFSFAQT